MGVSVVLLTYNEEENLKVLLPQIIEEVKRCTEDYEILVVDTAEPLDNTEEICKAFGARYVNQEQSGFGGAFRTAIKYAEKESFLIMDGDGSHPPKYISDLFALFETGKYDVVIGSRYVDGGKTDDAKTSVVMSWLLNITFRVCLGISAKDISTDYRMYHTRQLKAVTLTCQNYDILQEVLLKIKLHKPDCKIHIGEVPIYFQKRLYGESKRQLLKFIISYIKTLLRLTAMRVAFHFKRERK